MANADVVVFSLRMPRDLYERIKQDAEADDRPVSRHIVRLLRRSFPEHDIRIEDLLKQPVTR